MIDYICHTLSILIGAKHIEGYDLPEDRSGMRSSHISICLESRASLIGGLIITSEIIRRAKVRVKARVRVKVGARAKRRKRCKNILIWCILLQGSWWCIHQK